MPRPIVPVIDCTTPYDMLVKWPKLAKTVKASATASLMLADLGNDWLLESADLDGNGWAIDADNKIISLDTGGLTHTALERSQHLQNLTALRFFAGLRAAWQSARSADLYDHYRPDLWLLIGRILNADTQSFVVRMAYEARAGGIQGLWHHILSDDMADMATAYAHHFAKNPNHSTAALAASKAAFMQWFDNEARINTSDSLSLADMDDAIDDLNFDHKAALHPHNVNGITIDPFEGHSYTSTPLSTEIVQNPAWRRINNPLNEAHFAQIMQDIGVMRIGDISLRDKKLAARLFPDAYLQG